ncbi:Transposon Tn3 resolvase [Caloramator mitchellensis]|uniref:Transposon Tn3 resolvase n=1 Tax=Caloramator mitchellensis TaxID=908809 RepID=A0A0R3JTH4_CALMK|nr:recombinase family protein [Caloramator mitchellensis]KRQ86776.1 Transposon Tn3 resolvase [Caloramator mitchellensis]
MARAVTVIPATINRYSKEQIETSIKRVAAYARVSTDNDEQLSSYEAQVDHYTRYIKSNPSWRFVGVYSDEGISATSTKKREGFNRMIEDALNGKIDLIITKSVSRFARNTVDTLTTVRKLKEKGVEVYFEKENIYTLDSKGELLITIMSSLAQEESRSISEHVTWGQRKRFADGKVSLPYKHFLGYTKGEDGYPKIVEEEAEIVRLIYRMFLEGKTALSIAKYLTENKVKTPAGRKVWPQSTVLSILQNEKYKGDAILQKTFTVDFLTKKVKKNEGEVPQYYVENSHPAIIPSEVFDLVQDEIKKRKEVKGYKTGGSFFSGKIICGNCGSFYGRKVWHSTSKYRRVKWQCNNKFKNDKRCKTPHIYEDKIKKAFVEVFNGFIENKEEILKGYEEVIKELTDTSKLDKETEKLKGELEVISEMIRKCVEENARSKIDQGKYIERYDELVNKYEGIKSEIERTNDKRFEKKVKKEKILEFIKELEGRDELIKEFDEELWFGTVDRVVVNGDGKITLVFKDGRKIEWWM